MDKSVGWNLQTCSEHIGWHSHSVIASTSLIQRVVVRRSLATWSRTTRTVSMAHWTNCWLHVSCLAIVCSSHFDGLRWFDMAMIDWIGFHWLSLRHVVDLIVFVIAYDDQNASSGHSACMAIQKHSLSWQEPRHETLAQLRHVAYLLLTMLQMILHHQTQHNLHLQSIAAISDRNKADVALMTIYFELDGWILYELIV